MPDYVMRADGFQLDLTTSRASMTTRLTVFEHDTYS